MGKTTIIRQMSVSMGDGLSDELKREAKIALWNCIIKKTLHLAEDAMSEDNPTKVEMVGPMSLPLAMSQMPYGCSDQDGQNLEVA